MNGSAIKRLEEKVDAISMFLEDVFLTKEEEELLDKADRIVAEGKLKELHKVVWWLILFIFLPESRTKFDKLPVAIKKRMENQIKKLADFPNVRNCIKVQGRQDTFRLRVGDYRALFWSYFDKETIVIVDIDKRGRIYKRMTRAWTRAGKSTWNPLWRRKERHLRSDRDSFVGGARAGIQAQENVILKGLLDSTYELLLLKHRLFRFGFTAF